MANTGNVDGAIRCYLDVLTADADFDAAHFNLGLSYVRKRDFDAARASLSVYARKYPGDAMTTYSFGFLAETKPEVNEMIRLYAFFLERNRINPPSPESLGRLDVARGWVQHVETVLEQARNHLTLDHESIGPREVTDDDS